MKTPPPLQSPFDSDEPSASSNSKLQTILLVEDEEIVRRVAARKLARAGYHVLQARNAEEALAAVEERGPQIDLVVTDVIMPGLNGRQLAARLLEIKPDVKVLYMSGYPGEIVANCGILEPGLHFIEKADLNSVLISTVQTLLDAGGSPISSENI
jgi:two-component system, cell cycle sensor histidine kinase and response regulator CckA